MKIHRFRLKSGLNIAAMALMLAWCLFVLASFTDYVVAQCRPVTVNGTHIGNVYLQNLVNNRGLNVPFVPVNGDLNIINQYNLNWWQVVNRNRNLYPRIDPPNNEFGIDPDNKPDYYTNNHRYGNNSPFPNMWDGNNWWIEDWPSNGIDVETWLVTSGGTNVTPLVCFNWGVNENGAPTHPNFINNSKFNIPQVLNNSNFGNNWHVVMNSVPPVEPCKGHLEHVAGEKVHYLAVVRDNDGPIRSFCLAGMPVGTEVTLEGNAARMMTLEWTDDRTTATLNLNDAAQRLKYLGTVVLTPSEESRNDFRFALVSDDICSVVESSMNGFLEMGTLRDNYPNPFNASTAIEYDVLAPAMVNLSVFNMLGQKVATLVDGEQQPSSYVVNFDGSKLSSGTYIYCLQVGGVSVEKRMVLIK